MLEKTLHISSSPHLKKGISTDQIMLQVVYALLPTAAFSVYVFGLNALMILLTAVTSCVATEHLLTRWSGRQTTIGDYSALITGLLLGLILPPVFPLWMTFCGGMIAIGMGKFLFGGLGHNVFNPALVGRAVLQAAFPIAITTWYPALADQRFRVISSSVLAIPFMEPDFDTWSGATPLSAWKFGQAMTLPDELLFGFVSGSAGETSALIILLGGLYLIFRRIMGWVIPTVILGTVFALSSIFYLIDNQVFPSPAFMVLSGGLMLGAFFMATDMVASPITTLGRIVYGILIGSLVVVIRIWGGLPEGVMYAILLGNAVSPQIDRVIQPRVFGSKTPKKT